MKELDARGLECPQPVIMAKKLIESEKPSVFEILVTGDISRENVTRLGESLGYIVTANIEDSHYRIHMNNSNSNILASQSSVETKKAEGQQPVLFITSDKFGEGNTELGATLMQAFINIIHDLKPLPAKILFVNSGVNLTCCGSPLIPQLKELSAMGVEVVSCGTCLNFYNLKDKLEVGIIGNMYLIAESLWQYKIIKL